MGRLIAFNRAIEWLTRLSRDGRSVRVSSRNAQPYPEVSGYFIPTLIDWGFRSWALRMGDWLCSIQHEDGSWGDPDTDSPAVFDTGQVMRGLLECSRIEPSAEYRSAMEKACSWMVSFIDGEGRAAAPEVELWAGSVPEAVLLYAFEPARRAAIDLGRDDWVATIDRYIERRVREEGIGGFSSLSHFHAYILEALCDLGFTDIARIGIEPISSSIDKQGIIPAFPNKAYTCSTGDFQYAIVYYKLGDLERADKAFNIAELLQNRSGGWFGSYGPGAAYFPDQEISWPVKFYLDALKHKLVADFERMHGIFSDTIDRLDDRYRFLLREARVGHGLAVLDAGCGKGRYLRNLLEDAPGNEYYASDISSHVMEGIPPVVTRKQGSLLRQPFEDESFDLIYIVEALEHSVNAAGAIAEARRMLRPGGRLIVIDKDARKIGSLELAPYEQWFGKRRLAKILREVGFSKVAAKRVGHDGADDGLFLAWTGFRQ